jgi:signal recognition particle subunit SRP54
MPQPTPEQLEAFQKQMGGALPGAAGGIPDAPPPGAFNPPSSFPGLPGLGAPRLPGLGGGLPGGFNPFGGKKK